MKISLILPTYNVANYLPACLESCIMQDLGTTEYEIIIVIDGSKDNSFEIAQKYQSQHPQIKITVRENGGLSAARNTGLKQATGDYVWFIDPDDYIKSNCLKDIYKTLSSENLDCLWIQWQEVDENYKELPPYTKHFLKENFQVFDGRSFIKNILSSSLYAWSFIFRKDFLLKNDLKFTEGMYYEDTDFAFKALPLISRIKLYHSICYFYLQRNNSIVHSFNQKKLSDICYNIINAYQLSQEEKDDNIKRFYVRSYSAFWLLSIKESAKKEKFKSYLDYLKEIEKRIHFEKIISHGNIKNKLLILVYNTLGLKVTFYVAHFFQKLGKHLH